MTWKAALLWLYSLSTAFELPLTSDGPAKIAHTGVLSNVTKYVDQLAREFKIPGLSVAVVYADKDEPEYLNWGIRSEDGDPASEDTLYCIASNSKAFTATALGLLIDDFQHGRNVTPLPPDVELSWKTKVAELLPEEWKLKDEWASSKANLIDMLSHVTGLPRHEFSYAGGETVEELVRRLRYLSPTYELREQFQYNNQMYMTASYIISKYSSQSHMSFVQDRLFKPLGMESSTFFPQVAHKTGKLAENWINTAGPYFNETRRIPYFLKDWTDTNIALSAGPGGVIASTKDLTRWVRTLLLDGKDPSSGEQVIPKDVLETITSGHSVVNGKGIFPELSSQVYGAGWERWSYAGHEMVQHGGSVPGFSSLITLLPNDGVGIILLSNGDGQAISQLALTGRIIEELFSLPHLDWPGRLRNVTAASEEDRTPKPGHTPLKSESEGELIPLSKFAGTYLNPGYFGNLTLCAWPSLEPDSACTKVLSDYASVDPDFPSQNHTTLYAHWDRLFLSHIKLERTGNTTFEVKAENLFPDGCGRDRSPFFVRLNREGGAMVEFGLAEGGEVRGLGGWGLAAGPRERVPGEPEGSSEVWFDRVL